MDAGCMFRVCKSWGHGNALLQLVFCSMRNIWGQGDCIASSGCVPDSACVASDSRGRHVCHGVTAGACLALASRLPTHPKSRL